MNSNPNIPVIIKHIESVFDDDISSNACIQGLMYHGNEIECGEPAKYSGKMYEMLDDEGNVWWDTLVDDLNKTLHFNSVKNKYIGYIRCKYRLMNLDDDDYDDELYSIEYILKLSIKKIPTNFDIDNEFSDFDELKKLTGIKVHIKDIKPLRDFITDDNNNVNPFDSQPDPLEDPETLNDLIKRLKSQGKLTVTEKKRSKPITKEQWLKRAKYESDLFVNEFDLYNELTEDDWFYVLENIPALIYKYQELDIDFFDIDYLIYKLPGIRMFID